MGLATRHITQAKRIIPGKSGELSVIIPCAGIGTRFKSKNPKCLALLEETTIIEKQLNNIWTTYPKSDIFVVIGYQAEAIRHALRKYPVRFIYNPIFDSTNITFSIALALQAIISEHLLLIYGDLVFNADAIDIITQGESKLLLDSQNLFKDEEIGLIVDEKNNVTSLGYGLKQKWAQIAYFEGNELDLLRQNCYNDDVRRWFGYETINFIIDRGGKFEALNLPNAKVCEVDVPKDLDIALTIG